MKNGGYTYVDRIGARDEGLTVAAFYALRYPHSTEQTWRERVAAGRVRLNGRAASPDGPLGRGDRLEYDRPPWEEPEAPREFGTLFEDADVVAFDKPSGLPVLPGGMFFENTLLRLARGRYGGGCSPVHRLGRGTSGAILFSRNARAARSLAAAMRERRILKVYLALVSGTDMPDAFTVEAPIGPVPHGLPATVNAYRPDGRPSESRVRVLRRLLEKDATLVEVTIPTGRPHQIRIHLSHAGHPLVGDPLYLPGGTPRPGAQDDGEEGPAAGAREGGLGRTPGATGYLLHSWRVRFPHPATGAEVEVVAPPPPALDPGDRAA
jgi:23S rRNA pseudouridine1911/1915/1917 synthase